MTNRQRTSEKMFRGIPMGMLAALAFAFSTQETQAQAVCPPGGDIDVVINDGDSYCELCGVGQIRARVSYADDDNSPITNIRISQDLSAPALAPIPGTTVVSVSSGPAPAA